MGSVLAVLGEACAVREAEPADAVAGCQPRYVASPSSTEEASVLLRAAAGHRLRTVARGAGTKLDWGCPAEGVDLVVECGRLDQVLEYTAGDLVVRVQAGLPLAALQDACGAERQMLALDPVVAGGTVGGTLATNASGPYRMRYGTCRDLLIGVTVVRADGTVARSGGKVVKNVAGYDLGKLYIGSFGTLGLITEAVFRLHPRPAAMAAVSLTVPATGSTGPGADGSAGPAVGVEGALAAAERVRRSQLAVSALEVDRPEPDGPLVVAALVEDAGPGLAARSGQVAELLGPGATVTGQVPDWWGRPPWPPDGTAIKIAVRLSRLAAVLDLLQRYGVRAGLPLSARGSLGAGVLYAGLPASTAPAAVAELVGRLRAGVPPEDGSVVVLRTPAPAGADRLDRWGPVGGLALIRRVKEQFDPDRLLAPGRFVGGI